MSSQQNRKSWWKFWRRGNVDKMFADNVVELLGRTQGAAELELLDEAQGKIDFLEGELMDMEAMVDETVEEAESATQKLHEEDVTRREILANKRKEVAEKEKERAELANKVEAITAISTKEKKNQDEQQYDKALILQAELDAFRLELDERVDIEVRKAQEELEVKLQTARAKLVELQELIKKEQAAFIDAMQNVDRQKEELLRLQSAILYQTKVLEEKDTALGTHRDEIEQLRVLNVELRKLSEEGKQREEEVPKKKRTETARRAPSEIRVHRKGEGLLGFAVVGNDIDVWLEKTKINLKACIGSLGPDGGVRVKEYVSNPPDGVLCQICGCSTGPHHRSKCTVCRLLDLSDATLLP